MFMVHAGSEAMSSTVQGPGGKDRVSEYMAKARELTDQISNNYWPELDLVPLAHRPVFAYLKKFWDGAPRDAAFEKKLLSRDFRMKVFNLVALLYLIALERKVPPERVIKFFTPDLPGGDPAIAHMLLKIHTLASGGWDEEAYLSMLAAGGPMDPKQYRYNRLEILPPFDSVEAAVKFANTLDVLGREELHDAVDVTFGEIEEDPGWKR